jgi:hypothetical protein
MFFFCEELGIPLHPIPHFFYDVLQVTTTMSSITNKVLFHCQINGDALTPVANPFTVRINDDIDNPQAIYLLGYAFQNTVNPAPLFYWLECDQASIPITIHTNARSNKRFPLFLDNANDANNARISHWYDSPVPIAVVRNSTNRLRNFTLTIRNPDETLTAWTNMAMWLMVSTPTGNFNMKKTPIQSIPDPSYYDKQLGQEDVESILYR